MYDFKKDEPYSPFIPTIKIARVKQKPIDDSEEEKRKRWYVAKEAQEEMDRILREHQALSRINQSFNTEGMSNLYSKDKTPMNKGNAIVRTRNSRI
jgi:hypothetical protein